MHLKNVKSPIKGDTIKTNNIFNHKKICIFNTKIIARKFQAQTIGILPGIPFPRLLTPTKDFDKSYGFAARNLCSKESNTFSLSLSNRISLFFLLTVALC